MTLRFTGPPEQPAGKHTDPFPRTPTRAQRAARNLLLAATAERITRRRSGYDTTRHAAP